MNDLWQLFENWLAENWSEGLDYLNPPATDQDIEGLEAALGVELPEDYKACLRVHNGQAMDSAGMFDNTELLSTQGVLEQWAVWKELLDFDEFEGISSEPEAGIKGDWWNAKWIPFTHNGSGDHYCIDLDPGFGGVSGQVIAKWHDMPERPLHAKSFRDWFETYVNAVLAGNYVYSDDFGELTHIDYA